VTMHHVGDPPPHLLGLASHRDPLRRQPPGVPRMFRGWP
jgi:hypothetical protein